MNDYANADVHIIERQSITEREQCKVRVGGVFAGSFTPLQFIPMCWCVFHKEVHIVVSALQLERVFQGSGAELSFSLFS